MPSGLRRCTRRCRGQLKIFPDRARLPSAISAIPNVPPPGTRLPSFFCPRPYLQRGLSADQPLVSFFTTQWRVINSSSSLISLNFCTCVHGCLHDSELSIIPERWIVILVSFSLPCYNVKYPRQFTKRLPFLLPFP